jgi:PAS domain S-box-containing protein
VLRNDAIPSVRSRAIVGTEAAVDSHGRHPEVRQLIAQLSVLAGIVEHSEDAILGMDTDGVMLAWNPAAQRLFGYAEHEVVGQHVSMLVPPSRRGAAQQIIAAVLDGRTVYNVGTEGLARDGSIVQGSLTLSPARGPDGEIVGGSGMVRDESGSRHARHMEQRLASIVQHSGDAIISKDVHGTITTWNPAAERLFGSTEAEAVGQPISMLVPSGASRIDRDILATILDGRTVDHYETTRVARDGRVLDVSLSVSPLRDAAGTIIGASKIVRDISARKRLEAEQRRATELAGANEQLEAANQLKDEFLATASHEMRTPLASIAGFAETMQQRWDVLAEEQKRDFVEIIEMQARRMQRLVDELLTLARIESGVFQPRITEVNLETVVVDTIRQLAASGIEASTPHGLTVRADPDHVQQILANFLGNALKYGEPPITIAARVQGEAVELRVSDTGPGVPEEFVPLLFDRFTRGHDPTLGVSGTGLGLSISRALARAQHGDAWYDPGRDGGAAFVVRLPLARQSAGENSREAV